MLSVCDAFEAMTSLRRYRQTLSVPQAIAEIERCAGTQFDSDIAHVFARMVGRLHGQALRDSFSG
jgi:HD-GYP domain-containing protein (c-di-GMP phosphodiesterase class II)